MKAHSESQAQKLQNMRTHTADYRYILKELRNGEYSSVWALECDPETKHLPFISNIHYA